MLLDRRSCNTFNYVALQEFFSRMQDRLTALQTRFDASYFSPARLLPISEADGPGPGFSLL